MRSGPLTTDASHRRVGVRPLVFGRCALFAIVVSAAMLVSPSQAQVSAPPAQTAATYSHSDEPRDPFEGVNRQVFEVNMLLDDLIFEPSARAYRWAVPKPGRRSIANFLNNLDSPVILANDVLQGELSRAGTTTARFGINSTIGVLGLFDPARRFGLMRHGEDFGQTMGVHGVGGGPYVMAPLLGGTTPRDLLGLLVDQLFDPLTWVGGDSVDAIRLGLLTLNLLSAREAVLDQFDEIERTSIDFYAQTRSIYYQTRKNEIKNGKDDFSDLPDISELDAE